MYKFQPIIKWSGSKRSQCEKILSYFPKNIDTYYEPFCGGCSILMGLLNSDISVKHYVCSDLNEDLNYIGGIYELLNLDELIDFLNNKK